MSTQTENKIDWTKELAQPEIQESLTFLIQKLPDIQQSMQSFEQILTFGQSFLQDKNTIQTIEDRLNVYPINSETVEAGLTLLGKLPMLLQQVELLEQLTVFLQDVLNDEQSLQQINQSLNDLPLVEEGKEVVEIVNEIKARTEMEPQENVSLFTLMKWLKDPTVQKGLHYVKTTLAVLGERQK